MDWVKDENKAGKYGGQKSQERCQNCGDWLLSKWDHMRHLTILIRQRSLLLLHLSWGLNERTTVTKSGDGELIYSNLARWSRQARADKVKTLFKTWQRLGRYVKVGKHSPQRKKKPYVSHRPFIKPLQATDESVWRRLQDQRVKCCSWSLKNSFFHTTDATSALRGVCRAVKAHMIKAALLWATT